MIEDKKVPDRIQTETIMLKTLYHFRLFSIQELRNSLVIVYSLELIKCVLQLLKQKSLREFAFPIIGQRPKALLYIFDP